MRARARARVCLVRACTQVDWQCRSSSRSLTHLHKSANFCTGKSRTRARGSCVPVHCERDSEAAPPAARHHRRHCNSVCSCVRVCVRLCWTLRTRREPLVEITFHLDSETTPFPGPLTPAARRCIGFTRARSQLCSLHFGKNGRHTHARARETSEAAGAS